MKSKSTSVLFSVLTLVAILTIVPSTFAVTASSTPPSTGSSESPSTGSSESPSTGSSESPSTGSSESPSTGSSKPSSSTNAKIPEFGPTAILVLVIAVISIITFTAKTRIPRL